MKYCLYIIILLIIIKCIWVLKLKFNYNSIKNERKDIIERANYLLSKLETTPDKVLNTMPNAIGPQFQGEWALYSCSMLSASLVNISKLYPETKEANIKHIDSLINIVTSYELRNYDIIRWEEDPLENLSYSNLSHISYISHLAWMICGYKQIGGDNKYDQLLHTLCEAMNRRILDSKIMNLPTYPNEPIYIPDMLVAIVALNQYADLYDNKYYSTVKCWINKAKNEWCDHKTGLLVSFLDENGHQFKNAYIKGSYSSLNCYYLTLIDSAFAEEQYNKLKLYFWQSKPIGGLKEYYNKFCLLGFDIDAGPIIFQLSPSGTAFTMGSASYFNDTIVKQNILTTAEIAGTTIVFNKKRHYLLANIALVGESIMLAMRTNQNFN